MKSRAVDNPVSRFHDQVVSYDDGEGPPPAQVTLLDDHSRTILSENDSPDLPFKWSANPYRGCLHACSYCLDPETPILLADSRTRRIADLEVGDEIYGTALDVDTTYRRYVRTRVLRRWSTFKPAYRITLADGTELVASGDHRFLSERGWKYVTAAERPAQRPFLTTNNSLIGTGQFAAGVDECVEYQRGYLCGMIRGDATLRRYEYNRRACKDVQHHFRLALVDLEALARSKRYLAELGIPTFDFQFTDERHRYKAMHAIRNHSQGAFEQIHSIIEWPTTKTDPWSKGFLAGIFDAEGSRSIGGIFRISNGDPDMIEVTVSAMRRFGFDVVVESQPRPKRPMHNVRLRGGLREHLRFFHTVGPAITRKWNLEGSALKYKADLGIVAIEPLGPRELVDITTGTTDFIANGVVSHNCYARPTHEYLDLGAGTDFDTKIVVKRNAAELLRAAFDRPSWRGELVMFSGVTDCYQAIERDLGITRQCLEVCLEYRNPVAIITKSALIERDLDLLVALGTQARLHVSVSLAWTDAEMARAMEPWAPSPERRLKVIETLAKAGIAVSIMLAPIIPGMNDSQLIKLLERAAAAGATSAGWVLLRLPGATAEVFPERLRAALPLSADKVLHRIRETRGGDKLYDARFHTRGRGEGVYAQTIGQLFDSTCKRVGLDGRDYERDTPTTFQRPPKPGQLSLF